MVIDGDLAARARADDVSFLLALFVDLAGKPCAKLVPVEAAEGLRRRDGVGFAGFAAGAIGQAPQRPRPDRDARRRRRTRRCPGSATGLALVHCDPHVERRTLALRARA